jgi:hypothetical protein
MHPYAITLPPRLTNGCRLIFPISSPAFLHTYLRKSNPDRLYLLPSASKTRSQNTESSCKWFPANSVRNFWFFWLIKDFYLATLPWKSIFFNTLRTVSRLNCLFKWFFFISADSFVALNFRLFLICLRVHLSSYAVNFLCSSSRYQ